MEEARLRKGSERRVAKAVSKAVERVGELRASVGALGEARQATDASAALAQLQLRAFFDQVAQHKRGLGGVVQSLRKAAFRPITDRAVARRFLFKVAGLCDSSEGANAARDVAWDHVQRLMEVAGAQRDGLGTAVLFAQGDQSLQQWRAKCRVHVVRGGAWEVGEVSPSGFASLCGPRSWHAAAASRNGEVLVTGGRLSDNTTYQGSCERVVASRGGPWSWETVGAVMPTARYLCSGCMVGDLFVVVGGKHAQGWLCTVEAFDTARGVWHTLPSLHDFGCGCGVVSVGTMVVAIGGEDSEKGGSTAVRALDLAGLTKGQDVDASALRWEDLPSLSHPRRSAAVAAGDGRVFACGGGPRGTTHDASCESFDLRASGVGSGWTALPHMPEGRELAGCCYGGGTVFVAGGFSKNLLAATVNTVFVLNTRTLTWSQLPPMGTKRGACCAVCVGKRLLVIGGHDGSQQLATCEQYEF